MKYSITKVDILIRVINTMMEGDRFLTLGFFLTRWFQSISNAWRRVCNAYGKVKRVSNAFDKVRRVKSGLF